MIDLIEYRGDGTLILDFDIENRPISYGGGDWTFSQITAIAAKFVGGKKTWCWLYGPTEYGGSTQKEMLAGFAALWATADVVTGHYIRNHDIPIINGGLVEQNLPKLSRKMTSCTKNDLINFSGVSKSQENLCAMFGIAAPKVQMNQQTWREANDLVDNPEEAMELSRARVCGDVRQHIMLRAELLKRGMLGQPKGVG